MFRKKWVNSRNFFFNCVKPSFKTKLQTFKNEQSNKDNEVGRDKYVVVTFVVYISGS